MVHGFNIGAVIKVTLEKILESVILLILCKDLKFLYNCLVKLGTTQEKQLIVDVMSLRQLYKQCEIFEVKWFHRYHNLANSMNKAKASSVLKTVINTNYINISIIE